MISSLTVMVIAIAFSVDFAQRRSGSAVSHFFFSSPTKCHHTMLSNFRNQRVKRMRTAHPRISMRNQTPLEGLACHKLRLSSQLTTCLGISQNLRQLRIPLLGFSYSLGPILSTSTLGQI